ncbi:MAG: ABC transporter permease [Alphaproteobacteria bacterium]|tara:strand:- start:117 stop:1088 length:972 start_codon:yes stop_codon:yes gene_type:complete
MKKFIDNIRSKPAGGILLLFCTIQIVAIIAGLLYPENFRYLNPANIAVLLKSMSALGIMAIGVGILMISGEFDLSVGTLYTFCAIVTATMVKEYALSPYLAMIIGIIVGIVAGLIHGNIVNRFTIPSFIVTLGAMLLWKGGTLLYHGAKSLRYKYESETYKTVLTGDIGVIDASFLWFIGVGIVFYFIVHHHKIGNHFFAVGGNPEAAIAIGINPKRVKLIAFSIAGGCAALSGVVAMSRVGSVQPGGGLGLELEAIAACVIGGCALMGGRGSILGIMLGTALIYTIQDLLLLLRAPGFYFEMFVGGLIVLAVIINVTIRKRI